MRELIDSWKSDIEGNSPIEPIVIKKNLYSLYRVLFYEEAMISLPCGSLMLGRGFMGRNPQE